MVHLSKAANTQPIAINVVHEAAVEVAVISVVVRVVARFPHPAGPTRNTTKEKKGDIVVVRELFAVADTEVEVAITDQEAEAASATAVVARGAEALHILRISKEMTTTGVCDRFVGAVAAVCVQCIAAELRSAAADIVADACPAAA
jgi:hypothetical protein